jgi:hypothetical protein
MSTVATMEALREHRLDTEIRVTSGSPAGVKMWKRVDGGWSDGSTVLTDEMFIGAVDAGQVFSMVGEVPEPGQWWKQYDPYLRVLLAIDPDDPTRWQVGQYNGPDHPMTFHWVPATSLATSQGWQPVPGVDVQPWQRVVFDLARRLAAVQPFPDRFVADVHSVLDDLSPDDADRVNRLLDDYGVARPVTHRSTMTITGVSILTHDRRQVRRVLADDFEIEEIGAGTEVSWRRVVSLEADGIGCLCEDYDRDTAREYLPEAGEVDSFDYQVGCAD